MPASESTPVSSKSSAPARKVAAITPHNTNELTLVARSLYITTGGDLKITAVDDVDADAVTITVPDNFILPVVVKKVFATGTTATGIFALIGG
jgi:hypothetical protein